MSVMSLTFQSSKKYVSKDVSKELHTKAEPFIKWLKEAEEESSGEEEEDDSDVEVIFFLPSVSGYSSVTWV